MARVVQKVYGMLYQNLSNSFIMSNKSVTIAFLYDTIILYLHVFLENDHLNMGTISIIFNGDLVLTLVSSLNLSLKLVKSRLQIQEQTHFSLGHCRKCKHYMNN